MLAVDRQLPPTIFMCMRLGRPMEVDLFKPMSHMDMLESQLQIQSNISWIGSVSIPWTLKVRHRLPVPHLKGGGEAREIWNSQAYLDLLSL